ncbi:hypothetical protein KUV95_17060 [Microbulbifer agarilyticus]|uniref:hypothetical protein n=1 Tax=Microbulbifer agarilyticus TaxID=260552 RepID=UPI001C975991|nr:hypothetical protein [Microbulbifer agarilyticus]MBY6213260.1 hypothetical protein [Microbulbifer agarilyticus]
MEVQEFESHASSFRVVMLILVAISPVVYASLLAIAKALPGLRAGYIFWSSVKTYGFWLATFMVLIFTPAFLWGLEGKIADSLFIELTHPKSTFTSLFGYFMGLVAIFGSIFVPLKELRKHRIRGV